MDSPACNYLAIRFYFEIETTLWRRDGLQAGEETTIVVFFLNWYSGVWSPIGSTRHCGHQWPTVPAPGDYDDGEISGMIGRGNQSTRRKPAPVPLCPPQIPHAAQTRTRAAAVESQRLTA
jgi:hypothetical protein